MNDKSWMNICWDPQLNRYINLKAREERLHKTDFVRRTLATKMKEDMKNEPELYEELYEISSDDSACVIQPLTEEKKVQLPNEQVPSSISEKKQEQKESV